MSPKTKLIILKQDASLKKEIIGLLSNLDYELEILSIDEVERLAGALLYSPAILIFEISQDDRKNLRLASRLRLTYPCLPIIVISNSSSTELVFEAVRAGVSDFLTRPLELDELQTSIHTTLQESDRLKSLHSNLIREPHYQMIYGTNQKMLEINTLIDRVANTDVPILITGETGTGKELLARTIHSRSSRAENPFVKISTSTLPVNLLESELFGYEKGAFTGAYKERPGKLELANGGTVLMDEIAEMPLEVQAKLLHFLQDGQFSRVGGEEVTQVDIRVMATTNHDLDQDIRKGTFRRDLYYRLNVVSIHLPPLRDHKEDLPDMIEFFLTRFAEKYMRSMPRLSTKSLKVLTDYDWPGNIRELENLVKKLVLLGDEKVPLFELQQRLKAAKKQKPTSSGLATDNTSLFKEAGRKAAREVERKLILQVLQNNRWSKKRTAEILRISYRSLLYKIKEMRLNPKDIVA